MSPAAPPVRQHTSSKRWARHLGKSFLLMALVCALLLLPEPLPPTPPGVGQVAYRWRRDAFWSELEREFLQARAAGCGSLVEPVDATLSDLQRELAELAAKHLPPDAPQFDVLETNFFRLAPKLGACPERLPEFMQMFAQMRSMVKRQSEAWTMDSPVARERLYRSLYGGRAALEEAMLQAHPAKLPPLLLGDNEPSATPSAVVQGVTLHSGDILVSRGGAAASALIARGNDFPGNFSHVALVHIDESTRAVSVIEAHIECGVTARPIEKYLAETKLRILVLRPRSDLAAIASDRMLPHEAASKALRETLNRHIPYDFAMDHADPAKQFCSEVASAAYRSYGINLWMGVSHLSSRGVRAWLSAVGVRHFETQEPADLEYDPQLRVAAEWRDPEALFRDHVDNAVIDVLLERAEAGERLGLNRWLLPPTRVMKAYSVVKNLFGGVGPIPEGMSAATALRVDWLATRHAALRARVLQRAQEFQSARGFVPPCWELLRFAREEQGS